MLAQEQRDFCTADELFLKAMRGSHAGNNSRLVGVSLRQFVLCSRSSADTATQTLLREQWAPAGLEQIISVREAEKDFNE